MLPTFFLEVVFDQEMIFIAQKKCGVCNVVINLCLVMLDQFNSKNFKNKSKEFAKTGILFLRSKSKFYDNS